MCRARIGTWYIVYYWFGAKTGGQVMKKSRSKIIIKTRKGGYTKIYENGKWQKKVYNINFHADCIGNFITTICTFDKYKADKNGSILYDKEKLETMVEHCEARF